MVINHDLDGASYDGGTGSVESLATTTTSTMWKEGIRLSGGPGVGLAAGPGLATGASQGLDIRIDSAVSLEEQKDNSCPLRRREVTSSNSTLSPELRTPPPTWRGATTPNSLRTKAFFGDGGGGGGGGGGGALKSTKELMAQTRVSSDEVVEELLAIQLSS